MVYRIVHFQKDPQLHQPRYSLCRCTIIIYFKVIYSSYVVVALTVVPHSVESLCEKRNLCDGAFRWSRLTYTRLYTYRMYFFCSTRIEMNFQLELKTSTLLRKYWARKWRERENASAVNTKQSISNASITSRQCRSP